MWRGLIWGKHLALADRGRIGYLQNKLMVLCALVPLCVFHMMANNDKSYNTIYQGTAESWQCWKIPNCSYLILGQVCDLGCYSQRCSLQKFYIAQRLEPNGPPWKKIYSPSNYFFIPLASEISRVWCIDFLNELGRRTSFVIGDKNEKCYLFQSLLTAIQRGNVACFCSWFPVVDICKRWMNYILFLLGSTWLVIRLPEPPAIIPQNNFCDLM